MRSRRLPVLFLALGFLSLASFTLAQDKPAAQDATQPAQPAQPAAQPAEQPKPAAKRETVSRPLTEKERKKREAKLRKELEGPYKKWMNEDVVYIITDEERQAWKRLATDEEREQFIEQFWLRRDPTPDTVENEFKEEHYRRIAYANERYASGIPGWKADRGRIYIMYGPPDEIEDHSSGGTYERPPEEGGGTTSTYPFQQWRYRYIEGVGTNIIIEFVDPTMSGEFHMTMDPSEKDALLYVPNAGLTMSEQMGMSDKTQRFQNTDGTHLGQPLGGQPESMNEFTRLEQFAKLQKPPVIKFKDLEAEVNTTIKFNILPLQVRADYFPLTETSVLTNVTIQMENKDLQFQAKEGVQKAVVNMYGRITSMSRRVVSVFEETVTVDSPASLLAEISKKPSIYQKSIPLAPGLYRLNVVVRDIIGGNMNNYELALNVPRFDPEKLATSSLILADLIEKVPTKSIGTGQFVLGSTKVRPKLSSTFNRDEKLGIYLKVYNFTPDEKTQKPDGKVEYQITKNGTNEKIFDVTEAASGIKGASTSQITIEKLLPLQSLQPGQYTLKIMVIDNIKKQTLSPSASFTVN
jgi:GWxTD domain-containing protein